MSVQEMIEISVMSVVLLMSILLICAGIWFTWRLAKGDFVKIIFKNAGEKNRVALEGAATAVLAIVCIAAAVYLLTQAMALYSGGGYNESDSGSHLLSMVSTAVAAQETTDGAAGWAYLGPRNAKPEEQSFTTVIHVPGVDVMRTTRPVTLLDDHYERFTGSLVGAILGYTRPESSGQLDAGTCVRVADRAVVGNGHAWLEVEEMEPEVCAELVSEVDGLNLLLSTTGNRATGDQGAGGQVETREEP